LKTGIGAPLSLAFEACLQKKQQQDSGWGWGSQSFKNRAVVVFFREQPFLIL
jgi:hypothetical protein